MGSYKHQVCVLTKLSGSCWEFSSVTGWAGTPFQAAEGENQVVVWEGSGRDSMRLVILSRWLWGGECADSPEGALGSTTSGPGTLTQCLGERAQ